MIEEFTVRGFKSLEDVHLSLGQVNVFIGANGSGKSNLLEAIGVLSAAASGVVDDAALMQRGVRPGVPSLYKTSFKRQAGRGAPQHLYFAASSGDASYSVSLYNPIKDPQPAWRYKHELWEERGTKLFGRSPASSQHLKQERGLAALKVVERQPDSPAVQLLERLQQYVIYTPTTQIGRASCRERV